MHSDQDYRNCRRCSPQLQRPKMPPVRRIHGFAYASLVFAATELACIAGGEAPAPAGRPATQAPAVPVTIATVVKKSMPVEIRVIGTATAHSTVDVHPQVAGQSDVFLWMTARSWSGPITSFCNPGGRESASRKGGRPSNRAMCHTAFNERDHGQPHDEM